MEAHEVQCGPFRVDLRNECVWHGAEALHVRPKTFAVLRYFVTHPDCLVTKEELLAAVWPETVVHEAALNICISQLRRVLGDDPQAPRFIATVHRRGYRFIGALTVAGPPATEPEVSLATAIRPPAVLPTLLKAPLLVGREREVQRLHDWLERARHGVRQVVFVTGEPGIGKTTVVDAFAASLVADATVWVVRGQCLDHHGMGEAYLPVLDAMGRLCREPGGAHLPDLLRYYAPTWLEQMPALRSATALEAIPARGAQHLAGPHAARIRRGGGGVDGRPPVGVGPGGPALERSCHAGPDRLAGAAARARAAAAAGDVSTGRRHCA